MSLVRLFKYCERKKVSRKKYWGEQLSVSDKTISKWETGRGFPDISLLEPLAAALQVSVAELLAGSYVVNQNRGGNLRKIGFYVCPICGNVIYAIREVVFSCCGIALPKLIAEDTADDTHMLTVT